MFVGAVRFHFNFPGELRAEKQVKTTQVRKRQAEREILLVETNYTKLIFNANASRAQNASHTHTAMGREIKQNEIKEHAKTTVDGWCCYLRVPCGPIHEAP